MFNPVTSKINRPKASKDKTSSETSCILECCQQIALSSASTTRANNNNNNNKTSGRRIALALVTLSWSSFNAPLRSILNGFYYLAAIISLLLLIAYFHQAKAQQHSENRKLSSLIQEIEPMQQRHFFSEASVHSKGTNSNSIHASSGTKTAPKKPHSAAPGSQVASRATPISSSKPPLPPALPELTFRQANSDNARRGSTRQTTLASPFNETQPLLPSSSQWTPILQERSPRRPIQPPLNLPLVPIIPAPAPSIGYETRHLAQPLPLPLPSYRNLDYEPLDHYHHRPHHSQLHYIRQDRNRAMSEGRRTWRRPRFNAHVGAGYRQSKMYKRVLICDKTLVSLDYVRDFAAEARPFPLAHYSFVGDPVNFVDDNIIDLDLNGPTFDLLDRRASTPLLSNSTNYPFALSTTTTTTTATSISITTPTSTTTTTTTTERPVDISSDSSAHLERRSYQQNLLPDDDALVKCDMWDLEKGLKNRKPPADILDLAVKADFDTVRDAINRCRQLTEKSLPPDDEYRDGLEIMSTEDLVSLFSMKRGLLPGTKWCGLGDQASTYNDLGPKHRIDICCRAHDHCPIRLKPFRNDYGILNIALYTKSHCDCDADFYRCLREAHSRTADMLGNLYFNVMKLQCIREERLKVCREMRPIALGFERCVRYEENPMRRVFKFTTPPVAY